MSVIKVIEVLAESGKGWEDAAHNAVTEAAKTVRNIKSIYVQEMMAKVENDKIVSYRVNARISFVVGG